MILKGNEFTEVELDLLKGVSMHRILPNKYKNYRHTIKKNNIKKYRNFLSCGILNEKREYKKGRL